MPSSLALLFVPLLLVLMLAFGACAAGNAEEGTDLKRCIADLQSSSYTVRWDALAAMQKLGPKARWAVPALVSALKQRRDTFRVVNTLGKIDSNGKSAPALIALLQKSLENKDPYSDEKTIAYEAVYTLGLFKSRQAVPILIQALRHPSSELRYEAAHSLAEIGPTAKKAIPDLERLNSDHAYVGRYVLPYGNDVAASAALALTKIKR